MTYTEQEAEFYDGFIDYIEANEDARNRLLALFSENDHEIDDDQFSYRAKNPIMIDTYINNCEIAGLKPIPANDKVFEYFSKSGIPAKYCKLAWLVFVEYMRNRRKKQKDWRGTFRTYISQNYLKLWWIDEHNQFNLTTLGKQAYFVHKDELDV